MSNQYGRVTVAALLSVIALSAQDQARNAECTAYHEARAAYLLGCCGDQVPDYPGPFFRTPLSERERATKALEEIGAARKLRCYTRASVGARTLMLNSIGARLMRARALSRSLAARDLAAARLDIDVAVRDLRAFAGSYPKLATRLWYWIAMSFRRAGHTWDALAFVAGLPKDCCEAGHQASFLGDIYFELAIYRAASEHYSVWLAHWTVESLCGREKSLRNAADLRSRGFKIPEAPTGFQGTKIPEAPTGFHGTCVVGSEWDPYVGSPEG